MCKYHSSGFHPSRITKINSFIGQKLYCDIICLNGVKPRLNDMNCNIPNNPRKQILGNKTISVGVNITSGEKYIPIVCSPTSYSNGYI